MITRNSKINTLPDFESGEVILIDKDLCKTSFDVVYKVRKAAHVGKAGHAGTLDPLATGLLIICTGRKTKEISNFSGLEKTYEGIITLGKTTPSFDLETVFDSESSIDDITKEKIEEARKKLTGRIFQKPPMYSAVKHKGKALYNFARKGVKVEREPREIFISKFDINLVKLPDIHFEITCSKGTYIRVIANDLGKILGCGAYLKSLRRTKIGDYSIDDALTVDEFRGLPCFSSARAERRINLITAAV